MTYNYHAHTYRCSHATGTEEEYIRRAIQGGITHMGFSEHCPLRFSDGSESSYRLPTGLMTDYFSTLQALREQYRGQIDLKIGIEMEYYPRHFETMLNSVLEAGCEYLLLGQHFIHSTETDEGTWTAIVNENPRDLQEYVSCILSGMETGLFTYVAHPDIFRFSGSEDLYCREMRKICVAARERNIPLEINLLGIRDNRWYPRSLFWQMAGEEQSPVTFGFDAHDAEAAYDSASLPVAEAMVKKYRLNYIGEPKLVLLQKP
jgi:histidinol-phosphatase (PHP family)